MLITIDAERFHTKGGFYRELRAALCPDFEMGMNLDALNDVLQGGYGRHAFGEPLTICWKGFDKSRQELRGSVLLGLLRVIMAVDSERSTKLVLQTGEEAQNTVIREDARVFTLHGEDFEDMEGFYQAMDALLTDGAHATGHNLDALNDLLRGGFGVTGYGEPIALCWLDFDKSAEDLGLEKILTILTVMLSDGFGHDVHLLLA